MSESRSSTSPDDSEAPFGTTPRRSFGPVWIVGGIFLVWVALLIWMAATQVQS